MKPLIFVPLFVLLLTGACLSSAAGPLASTAIPGEPGSTLAPVHNAITGGAISTYITRTPAPPVCYRVTAVSLHVRNLPDYEQGAVIGYLYRGDVIHATARTHDPDGQPWLAIWSPDLVGWSSGLWLEPAHCPQGG